MTSDALALLASLPLEDGRRWGEVAEDCQWEDATAILEPGKSDPRLHYLTRARGRSKTTDLAGLSVVALADQLPAGAQGYAAAADKDQAQLLIREAAGFVQRGGLGDVLEVQTYQVTNRATGASVLALPADGPSAYGLRPWWLVVDELGQWAETPKVDAFWTALFSSLGKVSACRAVVITTEPPPGVLGHRVLQTALEDGAWRVHRVAGAPPWMSGEAVEAQRAILLPSAFRRLILNEPDVADEDRLVGWETLRGVVDEGRLVLEPDRGRRYVVTLDLGLRHDSTVLVVAHREDGADGPVDVIDRVERWTPEPGSTVDLSEVEAAVAHASGAYNRAPVLLDPWQASLLAQRLRASGVRVEEFTFTAQSVGRLARGLFLSLHDGRLRLPDDPVLLDELLAVRLRTNAAGTVRLDHASGGHDDQAVAVALAVHALGESTGRGGGLVAFGLLDGHDGLLAGDDWPDDDDRGVVLEVWGS